jgi:hypothetical protein
LTDIIHHKRRSFFVFLLLFTFFFFQYPRGMFLTTNQQLEWLTPSIKWILVGFIICASSNQQASGRGMLCNTTMPGSMTNLFHPVS